MLLVDLSEKRLIPDEELKQRLASRKPYGQWLKENQFALDALPEPPRVYTTDHETVRAGSVHLATRMKMFAF
jgi:glutamate synthase (ferredoxin)